MFLTFLWATYNITIFNKPFEIFNSSFKIVISFLTQNRLMAASFLYISTNSSKLVDKFDNAISFPVPINLQLAPATLFDSELSNSRHDCYDPPVPALTRPLHIVLMGGLKTPYGNIPEGDRVLVDTKCTVPPNACSFSENRSSQSLSTADMLLWQNAVPTNDILSSFKRPSQQLWVLTLLESPLTDRYSLEVFDNDQRRISTGRPATGWTRFYQTHTNDWLANDSSNDYLKRWKVGHQNIELLSLLKE